MNQGKLETIRKETECIFIAVLGVSEIIWTGMRCFESDNYRMVYSGNQTQKKWGSCNTEVRCSTGTYRL